MKNKLMLLFSLLLYSGITIWGQNQERNTVSNPQFLNHGNVVVDSTQLRQEYLKKAISERDPTTSLSLCEQFVKNFPVSKFGEKLDYSKIYERIILIYNSKGNYEKLSPYISTTPFPILANIYYKCIFVPYDRIKMITAEKVFPYSEQILNRMADFKYKPIPEYATRPTDEWVKVFNQCYFDAALTHINILKILNKNKEGLTLAEQAIHYFGYEKATLNEDYAVLLERNSNFQQLQQVLELSMKNNQCTNLMIEMLKKAYVAQNKSDNGFDQYMESLKDQKGKTRLQDAIKTSMIKKEIPPFVLKDATGKIVRSIDQKGKIIILDFWASWCAPCKASFAGMKLVVDKYKADSNVVFYFIDTQEHTDNYKEIVMRFIKEKGYGSFNVLFDNTIKGSKTNDELAKKYNIGPIPQKLVIDAKGDLRFVSVGYNGSPSELADEISIMIELVRAEK